MDFVPTTVKTYSGYTADQRPTSFEYQEEEFTVEEITDRWYEGGTISGRPVFDYFEVRTESGRVFLLKHNPVSDSWSAKPL